MNNSRLAILQPFRDAVWGNKHIFTERVTRFQSESNPQTRIVEYLDFGEHQDAVRYICSAMREEKLLVIQEYRDAMNNFRIDDQNYELGACILGQPGIGKSCFIAYAVVELLRERQPVAVEANWTRNRSQYMLFSENGVHLYDDAVVDPLASYPGIWAFSDSNWIVRTPTPAFTYTRGVRTFQTASPDKSRYKDWTKETGVLLYFMDLWSPEEIKDLAFIFNHDVNHISKLAEKWGPVPRTLVRLCRTPQLEIEYECAVEAACLSAAHNPNGVVHALTGPLDLGLSDIFFVKPRGKDITHRGGYSVLVPTRWLLSRLLVGEQLILGADNTRVDFFNTIPRLVQQ